MTSGTARHIDLVADVGESFGEYHIGADGEMLPLLTSANVACGFHAGDPRVIDRTIRSCVAHEVAIGAHPGFPDLVGFGRRTMAASREEIRTDVLYQIGAVDAFVRAHRGHLKHVSPHGRLGNLAVTDRHYAQGVADAVEQYGADLLVLTQSGELEREAVRRGLRVGILGLIDREYQDDGNLVPRREPGAVLHDPERIAERAMSMVLDGTVISRGGRRVDIACDSLLLHGDNAASVRAAQLVRSSLEREGVEVRAIAA